MSKVKFLQPATGLSKKDMKKLSTRITLESPYSLNWPVIKSASVLLEKIKRLQHQFANTPLVSFNFPILEDFFGFLTFASLNIVKARKLKLDEGAKLTWKEKNDLKRQQSKESWDKCKSHRQHLVFGMSNVIRSLEKDELCTVLVCRDVSPPLMIDPILSLCVSRKVIAAAVSNLGETMKELLNFKSCKSFGLKRSVADDPTNVFHELNQLILTTAPPLSSNHMNTTDNSANELPRDTTSAVKSPGVVHRPPIKRPPEKDYSHLYVKKSNVKPFVSDFIPLETCDQDEHQIQSKSVVDFISINLERKRLRYAEMKIKRIKPSKKVKPSKFQKQKAKKINKR